MAIDWAFIGELEGLRLAGYVPDPAHSKSGVTVAAGFDLGQRGEADLAGLPESLQEKLRPYLRLKGQIAAGMLTRYPLSITEDEAALLTAKSHMETVKRLREALAGFDAMPDAAQTVAASVALQYGDLRIHCPRFHALMAGRDWRGATEELKDFGDRYGTRRRKEAAYLKEHLS